MSVRHLLLLATVLLGAVGCATLPPVETGQHPQTLTTTVEKDVEIAYLLYLPEEYACSENDWPLILFLHGAGERGSDLRKVQRHGPPKLIAEGGQSFPFVVVSPQCPADEWWPSCKQIDTLSALLDHIVANYRIDADRVYVTGLSMGGFGTWRLAFEYPDRFAAIAPICGKGEPFLARSIRHIPTWVFHGAKDDVVPLQASQEMVDALEKSGGNVRFTVYPDAGHDSWTETYNNPELYEWFLKHIRQDNR